MPRKNALSRAESSIVTDSLRITQSSGLDRHDATARIIARIRLCFMLKSPLKRRGRQRLPLKFESITESQRHPTR